MIDYGKTRPNGPLFVGKVKVGWIDRFDEFDEFDKMGRLGRLNGLDG